MIQWSRSPWRLYFLHRTESVRKNRQVLALLGGPAGNTVRSRHRDQVRPRDQHRPLIVAVDHKQSRTGLQQDELERISGYAGPGSHNQSDCRPRWQHRTLELNQRVGSGEYRQGYPVRRDFQTTKRVRPRNHRGLLQTLTCKAGAHQCRKGTRTTSLVLLVAGRIEQAGNMRLQRRADVDQHYFAGRKARTVRHGYCDRRGSGLCQIRSPLKFARARVKGRPDRQSRRRQFPAQAVGIGRGCRELRQDPGIARDLIGSGNHWRHSWHDGNRRLGCGPSRCNREIHRLL